MTEATGMIVIHQQYNFRGQVEQLRFEWQGGDTVAFTRDLLLSDTLINSTIKGEGDLAAGSIFYFGPFKLRVIEDRAYRGAIVAVRYDHILGRLKYTLHRMLPVLDLAYRRFILMLGIWNLAGVPMGQLPSWQDIHLIKRFKRD